MSYSAGFCGKVQGYSTRSAAAYEGPSVQLPTNGVAISLYALYVRIAAAIVFTSDLRVYVWDFWPAAAGATPTLGVDKLVMISGTLLASDLWFWEPVDEGWKHVVVGGNAIEEVRLGFPFDAGCYVELREGAAGGTQVAGAANLFVSARFLT